MSESYIQNIFAERIGGERYGLDAFTYKFEKIKRAKRAALEAHPEMELFDLGVGEPDEMAFQEVVQVLCQEARKPENRGYADNGGPRLKEAAARYMERVCGVKLDGHKQIIHSIGSKAALSILPAAFINAGDVTLMTTPGYPVFGTHAGYYGGIVHNLPLVKENHYLPDLKNIPADVLAKAKVLVINYPNNPTGASATPEFFAEVVDFAKRNR
ncbi:MAG: aminotransferase class I/II-fold pyridoxal phosphate-dependent enzyme, partial [bacterium]